MTSLGALRSDTFSALSIPNYRRYVGGQAISLVGTWMQTVAQSWLVFQLTGSATAIGVAVALQTLPILLLGPYAGVVADRVDKRRMMIGLQAGMGALALFLGVLTLSGTIQLWLVYLLAAVLGALNAFENPVRQTFVLELVGPAELRNAVSLNSVLVNAARAVGPAVAGIIIVAGGTGLCFLLNALSFVAVVYSLATLDRSTLRRSEPTARSKGQLRQGIRYVRRTPELLAPLLMMALIGCFAYEFQVTLPILAKQTFGGQAAVYGFMTAAMGVGAVIGGLWVAARGVTGTVQVQRSAALLGFVMLLAALAPTLAVELLALALVGAGSVGFLSITNSTLQLKADSQMRGRVMALWAVAFLGSTPIGGPVAGAVSQAAGGRAGLLLGAASCVLAVLLSWGLGRRDRQRVRHTEQVPATPQPADSTSPLAGSNPALRSVI